MQYLYLQYRSGFTLEKFFKLSRLDFSSLTHIMGQRSSSENVDAVDSDYICSHFIDELDIDGLRNPCYLPELIKRKCLQLPRIKATFNSYIQKERDGLIDYSMSNETLFLILAASSLLEKMPVLRDGNFTDGDLPVKMNQGKKVVYSASDTTKSPWSCFEFGIGSNARLSWETNDVKLFMMHQWAFSAEVIKPGRFDYVFHQDCPLPYVDLLDKAEGESPRENTSRGHFGKVYKLGLHADHILPEVSTMCNPHINFWLCETDQSGHRNSILESRRMKSRSKGSMYLDWKSWKWINSSKRRRTPSRL